MIRKFSHTLRGLYYATRRDKGFQWQLIVGFIGLGAVWFFGRPLSELDIFMMVLATVVVLITELQNSSFEHALDRVHPDQHHLIGHSKDMAGAAVLLAALFAVFVGVLVVFF